MMKMLQQFSKLIVRSDFNENPVNSVLLGKLLTELNRQKSEIQSISDVGFKVYSQFDEDGIIQWLLKQIDVPESFVEVGVQSYRECNTRYLSEALNWSGLVIDASEDYISKIFKSPHFWKKDIDVVNGFIEPDNVNEIIKKNCSFDCDLGLLSIDIDGMDYWVWKAFDVFHPVIVVVEFNSLLGDLYSVTVPYEKGFLRSNLDSSNLIFGCSIKALIDLGNIKGYRFIGTSRFGCNAFFIRNDLSDIVLQSIEKPLCWPLKAREGRDSDGQLTFESAFNADVNSKVFPLIDLVNDQNVTKDFKISALSSARWKSKQSIEIGS